MSFERNQEIRTLESQYLKLRWKVYKYEAYLSMISKTRGKLFEDRIKRKLSEMENQYDAIWVRLCQMKSDLHS